MAAWNRPIARSLGSLMPEVLLSEELINLKISGLCLDSRLVKSGDLFIAIPGSSDDGRDHIQSSLKAGAEVVLAHADGLFLQEHDRVVPIPSLNKKISEISGRFYSDPSHNISLTGVTGTNGKTTCTQLLAQLFSLTGNPAGVIGTLGYGCVKNGIPELSGEGLTTPDPVTLQAVLASFVYRNIGKAVMEVSSHSLSQFRVHGLLFDTAIFTNLSHDHLDYHDDFTSYAAAKKQLFAMPDLQRAVINEDDPVGLEMTKELPSSVNVVTFSLVNPNASIYAKDISLSASGIEANIFTPWGNGVIRSQLIGRFNLLNLLAVVGAACCQGLIFQETIRLIPQLTAVPGRMEIISGLGDSGDVKISAPTIVVDFAHTPDALKNTLETLQQFCHGKLWCVFGCGGDRDKAKRPEMGNIASQLADQVVVTSDNPRGESPDKIINEILSEVTSKENTDRSSVHLIPDRRKAINFAVQSATKKDIVLVAGKGHELYQLTGDKMIPFSDQVEARLALQKRSG
ncbi:MAG: UDP-N-acetylmuramoyl-L-alanyl-D-glutamate--2,6-diaminopimelate ligase [Porticoccus sp.]|jgi:UDP-N-acetylmuramoyl-L-alanyl-D-glutamate--2,6-diaminopimelate ligase